MWGELGGLALVAALAVALLQATLPAYGVFGRQPMWQALAPSLAKAQMLALLVSLGSLTLAFLMNDFSLVYVAEHANTRLPWFYQITAVWGGHEGSLLLWVTILSIWGALVARVGRLLPLAMMARVLSLLGLVSCLMLGFIVLTSSPFHRTPLPLPVDGADLNPLLQDVGMIAHPPLLYMGYVGLAVPFAFAMAGLWAGRLDSAWARWSRPWVIAAWSCLSLGIALGSWWAYRELGWGGWWFWDPVENASFMPWLAATALMHSLAVTEKRGVFKAWTVLLAILAFGLSLLGTFLVRSGVLTSVHAFASDPLRGLFILGILIVVVGGGLLLFAIRGGLLTAESRYQLWSRETLLAINNLILLVGVSVVLLGTLYPLIADALQLGRVSVGPPYFNSLFVPLAWLLLVFMAQAPVTMWKQQSERVRRRLWLPALVVLSTALLVGCGLTLVVQGQHAAMIGLTCALVLWVLGWQTWDVWSKCRQSLSTRRRFGLTRSYWGMLFAHLGLLVVILGVTLTTSLSVEHDVALAPGQTVALAEDHVRFDGLEAVQGPNYSGMRARFTIVHPDGTTAQLAPEKRYYGVEQRPLTEAAITPGLLRDTYIALGDPLDASNVKGAWAVRVYRKPFVRLLWCGALLMAVGGGLALSDRRYRLNAQAAAELTTENPSLDTPSWDAPA